MEFMKHIKESFAEQDGGGNAYKAFKERLKLSLRALKAETDATASGEQEEEASARRKRAIALLEQVLELFSSPPLAGLALALKPLLPREWREDWSRVVAARSSI